MPELCVIEGDGIGREVIPAAVQVLKAVLPELKIRYAEAGWECFQGRGVSVPEATLEAVRACGAGLFGAVSSPVRKVEGYRSAILILRQELDCYASIRPVHSLPRLSGGRQVNMVIVRENTEGLYCGREHMQSGDCAVAERVITRGASTRIARRAMEVLRNGGYHRLSIIHKANILPLTDGLFRDCIRMEVEAARKEGEDWQVEEVLVDTAAYQIISQPERFQVVVTTNLFGDILSDAAAHWCGGMGMAASLNWGDGVAIAEPVHGSAPDIAGKGIANPIAAILSAALLLRYHWQMETAANRIENAVHGVVENDLPIVDGQILRETPTEKITGAIIHRLMTA